ncbi:hypothetical protein [Bacillus sp. JJ722]|uniref:hypothetical protein n=1 Tax=Bacillus sp. JJ722 TaxID=3122973 RepID=UPI003000C946
MTNQKVTLPADVAQALESALDNWCGNKERLLSVHAMPSDWLGGLEPLNTLDMITLASALINGYEIEKTPEEKVSYYYKFLIAKKEDPRYYGDWKYNTGAVDAIKETLNLLDIKIEGVNA